MTLPIGLQFSCVPPYTEAEVGKLDRRIPARPGGSLTEKPTCLNTAWCLSTSAFLLVPRIDNSTFHGSDITQCSSIKKSQEAVVIGGAITLERVSESRCSLSRSEFPESALAKNRRTMMAASISKGNNAHR